jgi:flagellar hook-associated protein 2
MSGIQISGLVNGSFDWQSVITQLIAIDSAPITALQSAEATNNTQLQALAQLSADATALQTASESLQTPGLFDGVSATSTTANSTWTTTADSTTAPGNYTIDVTNLATASSLDGKSGIGSALSTSGDVSGVTLATMATSTAPTAGVFTVDGKQVTVALTDTLQQVLANISTATAGAVTGTYSPSTDKITLASSNSSPVVLGAANDTSNLLSVLKLQNNNLTTVSSTSALGAAAINSPLVSADLSTPITGTDASGNGSFTVNGVSIAYNVNTDTVSSIIGSINNSTAGVTASYNPASDSIVLSNNATGSTGMSVADTTGTLMASLGLTTGSTLNMGQNAVFTINGGSPITSASNTLTSDVTGIPGLTVGVNSESSQTVNVAPDTSSMNTAIQGFISAYNVMQADITTLTQITTNVNGAVTTEPLAGDPEVAQWSEDLRNLAFNAVAGVSGTVQSLSDIGIDFTGASPQLSVTDQTTLNNALASNPSGVGAFFDTPSTGFAAVFNTYLNNLTFPGTGGIAIETNTINSQNDDDDNKITALQLQLNQEQSNLTTEFLAMQTAQSQSQSEESILGQMFNGSSSSGSSSSSSSSSSSVVPSSSSTT